MQWAEAEPDLEHKRQQKRHRVEAHTADAAGNRADAEGADAEQTKIEDRIFAASSVPAIEQQDSEGSGEENNPERAREHRAPDILDRQLQQRETQSGDEKPAQIEPRRRWCAEIFDQPQRQHHAGDPDRHVEIKDRAPREISR